MECAIIVCVVSVPWSVPWSIHEDNGSCGDSWRTGDAVVRCPYCILADGKVQVLASCWLRKYKQRGVQVTRKYPLDEHGMPKRFV